MRYLDLLKLKEETFKFFILEESLEAVRMNGFNLQWVKHQTEEICQEAVRQNPYSIGYIRIDIKDEKLRKARKEYLKYYTEEESLKAVKEIRDTLEDYSESFLTN